MIRTTLAAAALAAFATTAGAQELTWRNDILPIVKKGCSECHGSDAPEYGDWMLLGDAKRKKDGPRMDTYSSFMNYVVWPATGAMMRRLDDGANTGGKPGNMYKHLGETPEERAKNLATIKAWLGDGAWFLNRLKARESTPGVSKEQLEKVKAKY